MKEVIRKNHLVQALEVLGSGSVLLAIHGDPGSGKSTLLRQLRSAWDLGPAILIAVSSASSFASAPEIVELDLKEQLRAALGIGRGDVSESLDSLYRRMHQRAIERDEVFLIAIDGIEMLARTSPSRVSSLLSLLPTGVSTARVAVVTDPRPLFDSMSQSDHIRTLNVLPFSEQEVKEAFADLCLDASELEHAASLARWNPRNLALVHGVLLQKPAEMMGSSWQETSLATLVDRAIDEVMSGEESLQRAVGMALVSADPISLDVLRKATGLTESGERLLAESPIFALDEEQLEFRANTYRSRIEQLHSGLLPRARRELAAFYEEHPQYDPLKIRLLSLLSSGEHHDDVLRILSSDVVRAMATSCESKQQLRRILKLGHESTQSVVSSRSSIEFSLAALSAAAADRPSDLEDELYARVLLGDLDGAQTLAETVESAEDRLECLALVAAACFEARVDVPSLLAERITMLVSRAKELDLEDRILSIANSLLGPLPAQSFSLLQSVHGESGEQNRLDEAYVSLTLAGMQQNETLGSRNEVSAGIAHAIEEIRNPELRKQLEVRGATLAGVSSERVLKASDSLGSVGESLSLLADWMQSNHQRQGAAQVLARALDLAFTSSDYSPNSAVIRKLAICLPESATTAQEKSSLSSRIEAQISELARIGPTVEVLRLRLLLLEARRSLVGFDLAKGCEGVCYDVLGLADPVEKVAGQAWLLSTLSRFLNEDRRPWLEDLNAAIEHALAESIDRLLATTAEQLHAVSEVIRALAAPRPDICGALASRLNLPSRRDAAHVMLVEHHTRQSVSSWKEGAVTESLSAIVDPRSLERAASLLAQNALRFSLRGDDLALRSYFDILSSRLDAHPMAPLALLPLIAARTRIADIEVAPPDELLSLTERVEAFDDVDQRRRGNLLLLRWFARSLPAFARERVVVLENLRKSGNLGDRNVENAVVENLLLAARALVGICGSSADVGREAGEIATRASELSSSIEKAEVFAYLVVACSLGGRAELARELCARWLLPVVQSARSADSDQRTLALVSVTAAPAYFLARNEAWESLVEGLPMPFRDIAVRSTFLVLWSRCLPGDPFDAPPGFRWRVDEATIGKLLLVAGKFSSDVELFDAIERCVAAIKVASEDRALASHVRAEFVRQLDTITRDRFPVQGYISHEGYAILVDACVGDIRSTAERPRFEALLKRVRALPNVADQVFCLAALLRYAPSGQREAVIEEALSSAESLPLHVDQWGRIDFLAREVIAFSERRALQIVRRGLDMVGTTSGRHAASRRESLLSLAFGIDPDFASSLAAASDSDPARERIRAIKKAEDARHAIINGDLNVLKRAEQEHAAKAASAVLGSLNAGRVARVSSELKRELLGRCFSVSFDDALSLLALAVQIDVDGARSARPGAEAALRAAMAACLRGADVALGLIRRRSPSGLPFVQASQESLGVVSLGFRIGTDRDSALRQLEEVVLGGEGPIEVVDPYFSREWLEVFVRLLQVLPDHFEVSFLTSRASLLKAPWGGTSGHVAEEWRRLTSSPSPLMQLIGCGVRGQGESAPFHDRFVLRGRCGVQLGTSVNGLGNRVSTVSTLSEAEVEAVRESHRLFFMQRRVSSDGSTLDYVVLTVG